MPPASPPSHAVTQHWLAACARAIANDPTRAVHSERWLWASPPALQHHLRLPLVLAADAPAGQAKATGYLAQLTLALLPCPQAGLSLAPLPASALLPQEQSWVGALTDLEHGLQGWLLQGDKGDKGAPAPWADWAIGWDVSAWPGQPAVSAIGGRSAAATLALGVLKLLHNQAWLNPEVVNEDWLCLLAGLRVDALQQAWISADLHWPPGGLPQLRPVNLAGLKAKAKALWAAFPEACLHTAPQALLGPTGLPYPSQQHQQATDWPELLRHIGAQQGLTPHQAKLQSVLMAQDPEDYFHQQGRHALLANADLAQLVLAAVDTPAQAALHQFARWELRSQGPVTQSMVPLQLAAEVSAHFREHAQAEGKQEWPGLDAFLQSIWGQACFVLEGGPGAGTLLRHAVQTRCWQALRAWQWGGTPAELMLYLPLHDLPDSTVLSLRDLPDQKDEKTLIAWAHDRLRKDKQGPWADAALGGGAPQPWWPRQWRWVLDGLNELKVPPGTTDVRQARSDRANALVQTLQAALPHGHAGLPLLSTRPGHLSVGNALTAQVQEWSDTQIESYLRHRFEQGTLPANRALVRALTKNINPEDIKAPPEIQNGPGLIQKFKVLEYCGSRINELESIANRRTSEQEEELKRLKSFEANQKIEIAALSGHDLISRTDLPAIQEDLGQRISPNLNSYNNTEWLYFIGAPQSGKTTAIILFANWVRSQGELNMAELQRWSSHDLVQQIFISASAGQSGQRIDTSRTIGWNTVRLFGGVKHADSPIYIVDIAGEAYRNNFTDRGAQAFVPLHSSRRAAAVLCVPFVAEAEKMIAEIERLHQIRMSVSQSRQGSAEILPLEWVWLITKYDRIKTPQDRKVIESVQMYFERKKSLGGELIFEDCGDFLEVSVRGSTAKFYLPPPLNRFKSEPFVNIMKYVFSRRKN